MESPPDTPSDSGTDSIEVSDEELVAAAREAAARAYAPYSGFTVRAALVDESGRVFTAANVENSSFGLTICAERAAVCRALAEGAGRLVAVAVACNTPNPVQPCGACRQVLAEFAPRLRVVAAGRGEDFAVVRLDELLPGAFRLDRDA